MVKLRNTTIHGLIESIIASGYPLKSKPYSESEYRDLIMVMKHPSEKLEDFDHYKRAQKLGRLSGGHNNYLKGIIVQADLTYPQYFTPQLQRYNWIDIVSSHSKMHTLTKTPNIAVNCNKYVWATTILNINRIILIYNTSKSEVNKYRMFMEIISNLPMGYELTMRISTNYLQLVNIWNQRHKHKLKEDWGSFCEWITELPHFSDLTGIPS